MDTGKRCEVKGSGCLDIGLGGGGYRVTGAGMSPARSGASASSSLELCSSGTQHTQRGFQAGHQGEGGGTYGSIEPGQTSPMCAHGCSARCEGSENGEGKGGQGGFSHSVYPMSPELGVGSNDSIIAGASLTCQGLGGEGERGDGMSIIKLAARIQREDSSHST